MSEDFRRLLEAEMVRIARRDGRPASPVSPAALALCDAISQAFRRYSQHVVDCQQTAIKAYEKAAEIEKRLAAMERRE